MLSRRCFQTGLHSQKMEESHKSPLPFQPYEMLVRCQRGWGYKKVQAVAPVIGSAIENPTGRHGGLRLDRSKREGGCQSRISRG